MNENVTLTYLKELGDCRVNNHQRAMNQVNDTIFHRNISHHDLSQNNASGVLWIANDCIRLDIRWNGIRKNIVVIRINKALSESLFRSYF